ncbi:hypothetical protein B0H21DRAFT_740270 [Amylocystis lapponica]|nr:hypothetical protein B0H21DRAFT_740270 [Amylocystis lapponica]
MFQELSRWQNRKADSLPVTNSNHSRPSGRQLWLSKRYTKLGFAVIVSFLTWALFRRLGEIDANENLNDSIVIVDPPSDPSEHSPLLSPPPPPPPPPLYEKYHKYELQLPQHNPHLPYPEGREGKYLYIENHAHASGWNNVMQETMLNTFLSHIAGRTFVFYNYTWNPDGSMYSLYNGKYIPSKIPMTALLSGPIAGQPFLTDYRAPRAVGEDFYNEICPESSRPNKAKVEQYVDRSASAATMTRQWMELLDNEPRCVHLTPDTWQIFDIWIFGDPGRLLDIWPAYSRSPILTEFRWSSLIEMAFDTNCETISPTQMVEPYLLSIPVNVLSAERYSEIPGLLAMHVRRGDYEEHCRNLADWSAGYTGFNSFPSLPDKLQLLREHCWPTVDQIVQRAEDIRRTPAGQGLRHVFIMSNGAKEWMDELKYAFERSGHWTNIANSRDILLTQEQNYVKQAVDMVIGQRAQVFVGNGVCVSQGRSCLGNQPTAYGNGFAPDSSRHW